MSDANLLLLGRQIQICGISNFYYYYSNSQVYVIKKRFCTKNSFIELCSNYVKLTVSKKVIHRLHLISFLKRVHTALHSELKLEKSATQEICRVSLKGQNQRFSKSFEWSGLWGEKKFQKSLILDSHFQPTVCCKVKSNYISVHFYRT